jgi:hypothetical protein
VEMTLTQWITVAPNVSRIVYLISLRLQSGCMWMSEVLVDRSGRISWAQ